MDLLSKIVMTALLFVFLVVELFAVVLGGDGKIEKLLGCVLLALIVSLFMLVWL